MSDEGFVRRWSRRKTAARAPEREPEPVPLPEAAAAEPAPAPGDALRPKVDPATLPAIESLTYQSDYTAFLRPGVPPEMRNRALQRLWRSDPLFGHLDGLVEYGLDYSKVGMVKEVVRTAYQVGRGMLDRVEAAAAQAPAEPPADLDVDDDASAEPAAIEAPAGEAAAGEDALARGDGDATSVAEPRPPLKRS